MMNNTNRIEKMLLDLHTKVDALSGLGNRFDGLEGRFDGLESRFDGLESRFDGLEHQVRDLREYADWGFATLVGHIHPLEINLNNVDKRLCNVEGQIENTVTRLTSLEGQQRGTDRRIDDMHAEMRVSFHDVRKELQGFDCRLLIVESQ